MANPKHLFLSASGTLLPEWKLAFSKPQAQASGSGSALPLADLIWLRLQSGEDVTRQILALQGKPGVADRQIIILSDTPNDDEALAAFGVGARGYVNTHAGAATLKQVARVVTDGGLWVGEALMRRLMLGVRNVPGKLAAEHGPNGTANIKLTDREREVARAIALGASNKEVARQLNITERTVKAHVSGLFTKLGVQDRLQLALKVRDMT